MGFLGRLVTSVGRLVVYLQVLCFLPLALDLGGRDCFLAYGASLASYYALLSTFRLVVKRTRLEPLGNFLAAFQVIVVPLCLLVCFNVYSPPAESYFAEVRRTAAEAAAGSIAGTAAAGALPADSAGGVAVSLGSAAIAAASRAANKLPFAGSSSISTGTGTGTGTGRGIAPAPPSPPEDITSFVEWLLTPPTSEEAQRAFAAAVSTFFWLAKRVPPSWSALLRFSSPAFSLLEAVSTLLVIQSVGTLPRSLASLSRPRSSSKRSSTTLIGRLMPKSGLGVAELWQILFLLLSALTYVVSSIILFLSFEGATRGRPGAAAAVGACVSSTLWLTAISFALHRGNVVETSLIAAYVTFNVVQLPDSLAFTADPLALIRSFKYAAAGGGAGADAKQSVAGTLLTILGLLPASSPSATTNGIFSSPSLDPARYLPRIVIESAEALWNTIGYALAQSIEFIAAAASALPASVIISLVYRLVVLYAAIRILPRLKADTTANAAAARRTADADQRWAKANAAVISPGRTSRMLGVPAGPDSSTGRSRHTYSRSSPRNSGVRAPMENDSTTPSLSPTGPGRPSDMADKSIGTSSTSSSSAVSSLPSVDRLGTESEGMREPSSYLLDSDPAGVLDMSLGDETEAETDAEVSSVVPSMIRRTSGGRANGGSTLSSSGSGRRINGEAIAEEEDEDEGELTAAGERRLRDQEPFGAFISILISYSRLILIAVYSHLLLLDQSHQIYWRFLTIASCLLLWTFEILLGHEDQIYKLD
ncbi:unnamed protein product [Tilletia laevis]|uniref:ICE2-domain-containing protein n=1 Tax=Tilletia laevis TaxID=157183 RepID=A0A9N8MCH3_9BASI|nr:hypothetical protein CF336_g3083 [Tilletia laevis]CAD6903772.1 unnamed protein product [Tilletia caries]CAD6948532.1 unnamed protein product [Tilletia laevis]CAD6966540.1 unnamed protein product [Tilletia laevis]CAD7068196.1 unnamed protein product [Tilletia caries]